MRKIYSLVLMAAALLVGTNAWAVNITSRSELQSFLTAAGTNTGVIAADLDLSNEGAQFVVAGTKELTINNGVTLSLKSAFAEKEEEHPYDSEAKLAGFCFRVPNGAELTIKGNGSIHADRSVVLVENGGKLTIGESSKATQLNITTTEPRLRHRTFVFMAGSNVNIYNANVLSRSAVVWNAGNLVIDGGTYHAQTAYNDGTYVADMNPGWQTSYTLNSRGTAVLKNATFLGTHGGVSPEEDGRMEIVGCTVVASPANAAPENTAAQSFHALYVCTRAIVTVKESKLYSQSGYSVYDGNNDALHTFGLIYLYDNCYLRGNNFNSMPYIQKKSATDDDRLFPVSISEDSEWYEIANTTGTTADKPMPLPSGYAYEKNISAVFDGRTYKVRVYNTTPAEQQEAASVDPAATIPWQQSTTWTGDVPAATDVVTIPEGKTVVIKNDEATTDVAAAQVTVEGEGASLTVEDGTSLKISESLNITTGAKLVIDAGAVVTVGAGGVVTSSDDAIEVKTSEGKTGVFMLSPAATENTHPMAKVELTSKGYKRGENDYVWQRFGVPSHIDGVKRSDLIYDHVAYPTSVMKVVNQNWADMDQDDVFVPFKCYALTTSAVTPGAVYTFQCNLMGNGDAELQLTDNWNYYANSYTAPIDIAQMIGDFSANYPNVSATVYLYRASDDWWYEINNANIGETGIPSQIDPMQAFIFERRTSGSNPIVNYLNQIWNPIMNPGALTAPQRSASFSKAIVEVIAADGTKDVVRLIEGNQFSNNFDNSYDATKYMNSESFNLYATGMEGEMAILATNNLVGTMLDMTTKEQTSFTMTFSNVNGMDYAIRDNLTNTETVIAEGATYMFSVPENTTVEGRFEIVNINRMPTAIDNVEESASQNGIYTITGQYVGNDYHSLPAGIYVVDGKKVVK